jgi:hypothetical protein
MLVLQTKKFVSEQIKSQAELMLQRLRCAKCPIWRFHYLGAISAYIDLAKNLDQAIPKNTLEALYLLEQEALSYLESPNQVIH